MDIISRLTSADNCEKPLCGEHRAYHASMYIYVHIYTCTCIYMYTYIHAHVHVHEQIRLICLCGKAWSQQLSVYYMSQGVRYMYMYTIWALSHKKPLKKNPLNPISLYECLLLAEVKRQRYSCWNNCTCHAIPLLVLVIEPEAVVVRRDRCNVSHTVVAW